MMSPADHIAQLEYALREQMGEIDRLRGIIDQKDTELNAVIAWIAGDDDALGVLRSVYVDPRTSVPNKVKAASSALPFERSKPASLCGRRFSWTRSRCTDADRRTAQAGMDARGSRRTNTTDDPRRRR
jgi:hypothetical protein